MSEQWNELPCGFLSLNQDGNILAINSVLLGWLGHPPEEIQGKHVDTILTPASQLFYQMYFFPMLRMQGEVEEMYLSLKSRHDGEVPVLLNARCRDLGGSLVNDAVVIKMATRHKLENELIAAKKEAEEATRLKSQAITELQMAKEELQATNARLTTLATTDSLTGLKNRRSFQEALDSSIAQFGRLVEPLSLLLIDIDHFKMINDTRGHSAGDLVLQKLGQVLKTSFRAADTVARFGGEEFAVILPGVDPEEAARVGEKLRGTVEGMRFEELSITVSIGVATLATADSSSSLLNRADAALYRSKGNGRNRVSHYRDDQLQRDDKPRRDNKLTGF